MMTIRSTLYNDSDGLLFDIPAGKPNPQESYSFGTPETRSRVFQSAYKAGDSWEYGLNFLRPRVGKIHPPELKEARRIELLFKQCRKEICESGKSDPLLRVKPFVSQISPGVMFETDSKKMRGVIAFFSMFGEDTPHFADFIQQAEADSNNPQTYGDFLVANEKARWLAKAKREGFFMATNEARCRLLKEFGVDYEKRFDAERLEDPEAYSPFKEKKSWGDLSVENQLALLMIYKRQLAVEKFGLQVSKWQPKDGCEQLIVELQAKGPLCVGSTLGRESYQEPPLAMVKPLGGRTIYYWKKGTYCKPAFNTLLLIGARIFQEGSPAKTFRHVYFIDPADPSDPKNSSLQRIYAVSYDTLSSHLLDVHGVLRAKSSVGYAVHA